MKTLTELCFESTSRPAADFEQVPESMFYLSTARILPIHGDDTKISILERNPIF